MCDVIAYTKTLQNKTENKKHDGIISTRKRLSGIVGLRDEVQLGMLNCLTITTRVVRHVVGCYEDNKHYFLYCSI